MGNSRRGAIKFFSFAVPSSPGVSQASLCLQAQLWSHRGLEIEGNPWKQGTPGHSKTSTQVMQTMLSHLVVISLTIMATSASVVMTRVERVCPGSNQCLPFSSCTMLQGRNKQDTLQAIRQLQCGFSGSSPMVCCPPSLPRKAVTSNNNPAVDVNVNSRTNLDIGGLNARSGNFPVSQEETTLWSEEFGPK